MTSHHEDAVADIISDEVYSYEPEPVSGGGAPPVGEVLTVETARLLRAGDVLRVILPNTPLPEVVLLTCAFETFAYLADASGKTYHNWPWEYFAFIGRPDEEGWMPWSGGKNPFGPTCEELVECRFPDGTEDENEACIWDWNSAHSPIIAFRLTPAASPSTLGTEPQASKPLIPPATEGEDQGFTTPETGFVPVAAEGQVSVHPDKTAARAVDACGGTYTASQVESRYAEGHADALRVAQAAVKDCDDRMAELLEAAQDALQCYDALLDDFRMGDPAILKALADAIATATGAA